MYIYPHITLGRFQRGPCSTNGREKQKTDVAEPQPQRCEEGQARRVLHAVRRNGHRPRPKAIAVIIDHVKDEDGDGAVNVTDVELFLTRNKANRIALKTDGKYAGGDFRSTACIALLKEADIVATNPPFSLFRQVVYQAV